MRTRDSLGSKRKGPQSAEGDRKDLAEEGTEVCLRTTVSPAWIPGVTAPGARPGEARGRSWQ